MEYVCKDPKATARGSNVLAIVDAFQLVPAIVNRALERHGIERADLVDTKLVPMQTWLDALEALAQQVGHFKLREVGSRIVENAEFPPHFATVESVLLALDTIYHLNGAGEIGHYRSRPLPSGALEVMCSTPFPAAFERGLIEGIVRNPRLAQGRRFTVQYVAGPAGGDLTCTLIVHPM